MKAIPKDIAEKMSFLSFAFSVSMKGSIHSKEDLYNDLVVFYLKNYDAEVTINEWFISFKNFLINKYRRHVKEKEIKKAIKKEIERTTRQNKQ